MGKLASNTANVLPTQPTNYSLCLPIWVTCQQCHTLVCLFVHSVDCKCIFKLQNKYQGLPTDMLFHFLLNQDTRLFPRKKHPLGVLFLSSKFPTQSASQYHTKLVVVSCVYQISNSAVPLTYLMIFLMARR